MCPTASSGEIVIPQTGSTTSAGACCSALIPDRMRASAFTYCCGIGVELRLAGSSRRSNTSCRCIRWSRRPSPDRPAFRTPRPFHSSLLLLDRHPHRFTGSSAIPRYSGRCNPSGSSASARVAARLPAASWVPRVRETATPAHADRPRSAANAFTALAADVDRLQRLGVFGLQCRRQPCVHPRISASSRCADRLMRVDNVGSRLCYSVPGKDARRGGRWPNFSARGRTTDDARVVSREPANQGCSMTRLTGDDRPRIVRAGAVVRIAARGGAWKRDGSPTSASMAPGRTLDASTDGRQYRFRALDRSVMALTQTLPRRITGCNAGGCLPCISI